MSPARVEIPTTVQYVRVEGDYVLMDLKSGTYLGLDAVASHIWLSLADHGDLERAAGELCEDYEVELDQALADIERWVAELEAKGLVVRCDAPPEEKKAPPAGLNS